MRIDANNNIGPAATPARNNRVGGIAPTNPHHIARAYGVRTSATSGVAGSIQPSSPAASVTPSVESQRGGVRRLVAGVVPGGVEFTADAGARPRSSTEDASSLAMYRHPADKNAAATAVNVGRRLDIQG